MKQRVKDILFGVIVGMLIVGSISVFAVSEMLSSNIEYDNSSSGLDATNAQDAIDELYKKFSCVYDKGYTWSYTYTGAEQSFLVPCDGTYKIELWGAQGGDISSGYTYTTGGNGAYTSGNIILSKGLTIYLYLGKAGTVNETSQTFNGGGKAAVADNQCASGGGATDVRLVNGTWSTFESLKSRIMVAAGGAGAERNYAASVGGGLTAVGSNSSTERATQISGYAFGIGQAATNGTNASGAGSGYYGGTTGYATLGSSGGTSFISGHEGCNAISESSTSSSIVHTSQSIHYSGYKFTNTVMVDGSGYNWTTSKGSYTGMPTHDSTSTMTGNSGNGYVKITYVGTN